MPLAGCLIWHISLPDIPQSCYMARIVVPSGHIYPLQSL
ncbi:hypothetical protein LCGC14_1740750, partial [marine sediment metagenome]